MHGFQPPCIGETCAYDIRRVEFVQIANNGQGHWLTVSTVGAPEGTVNIYDSLYMSVNTHIKDQILAIIYSTKKEVTLNFLNIQTQAGTCDCRLFSSAFANCLANGIFPEKQVFNQAEMRHHLYSCLDRQELTNFPTKRTKTRIKSVDTLDL